MSTPHTTASPSAASRRIERRRGAFAGTLARVIHTSQKSVGGSTELLMQALEQLELEPSRKLWALMLAGEHGEDVGAVHAAMAFSETDARGSTTAMAMRGNVLADYLRRGEAIAVATALDLETPLASWPLSSAETVDDRAWLRFARLLAFSGVHDWESVGLFRDQERHHLKKMYLRYVGSAWWSFRRVLDRPSSSVVEKERASRPTRSTIVVVSLSIRELAVRAERTNGPALARAVRAIRVRFGAEEQADHPKSRRCCG